MPDLILHNYFRSSTSYRVRIALHHKNLSFQYQSVHLINNGGEQHKEEYRRLNPAGEVPTLVHGSRVIGQSMAILQYLDDVFPQQSLLPKDAGDRAKVLQIAEGINCAHSWTNLKVTNYLTKEMGLTTPKKDEWVHYWLHHILSSTEKIVSETGRKFSFGDSVSLADLFLVPLMFTGERFKVDIARYPHLLKINDSCLKLEAFKKAHPYLQTDCPEAERISP